MLSSSLRVALRPALLSNSCLGALKTRHVSTSELLRELGKITCDRDVSTNPNDLQQHGKDEGPHRVSEPQVVVFPQNKEQVAEVLKFCNRKRVPVVPFGSGSGLEGGASAPTGGVAIDLRSFTKILRVSPEDFDCTVEAGVTWRALNFFLRDRGLWFPVDPGADASLGGMCSTSASGTNAVRYGTMRENVLNLEVVLADGRIINTGGIQGRARKSAAGYNLTNLFVGSEGTLGIITAATLRLHAIPEKQVSAVVQFETPRAAIDTVVEILQNAVPIARVEFMDERTIQACNAYSKTSLEDKPTLMLEFNGSQTSVSEQIETVASICEDNGGTEFKWAEDQEERNLLWKARHSVFYATCAQRPNTKCYVTDVCVPISKLPELLAATKEDIDRSGVYGTVVGHVGDGNFHTMLLFDPKDPASFQVVHELGERMALKAIELDGTCTGEHGVGLGKKELLLKEHGSDCVSVMKSIKLALDPHNILNPTKIFD
ncbi:probable D-lactate dehydrogenase, mitochondrial [Galendromus occidentalis]|uniref:D-lactate dehydrogenase (cytochrome) n=1 Tax=Galendromus occidentalis TaxID=34638 RepID=A0AAJ7L7Z2_9ACAR|nr:probable D-lactate dehydrogenase, mitochondrial [Galendromus occidentalis]